MTPVKSLTLQSWHETNGGKMGEFAGYTMPLYYTKPLDEHHVVRNRAGLFDISHMGQFDCRGQKAEAFLQHALTNNVLAMKNGQALYSPLCREDGGVLDDLIIYRHDTNRYRIIVNGATRDKDFAWLKSLAGMFEVSLTDITPQHCLFAIQGPQVFSLLAPHLGQSLAGLKYYAFMETTLFGVPVFLARTGYTGEPGVEVAPAVDQALFLWKKLTEDLGIPAIGLAARDTLRLEAAMPLYGHELREAWTPLESGVGWTVKLNVAEDFVGKGELTAVKARGPEFLLVGLEMIERGIPREGYPVLQDTRRVGEVTSGTHSPTLGKSIALAHVEAALAVPGTRLKVEIRDKALEAQVVKLPFYSNPAVKA